jgi:S1-C subfamily serine protease
VVYISVDYIYTSFFSRTLLTKTGSGVILSPDGYILTNNHVVEDARAVKVVFPDDAETHDAEIVGTDPLSDLAVIKVEGDDYPAAEFGVPSNLRVGDWVVALGNALGLEGGPTVTVGIVSNLERSFPIGEIGGESAFYDVIQTDADINRGNSGGPLVDLNGGVVGINTFVLTSEVETAGFAVNTSTAQRVYEDLVEHGRVTRPYLGVNLRTVTPALATELDLARNSGVLVWYVQDGGPADDSGLQTDDVIVRFEGQEVNEAYLLTKLLWQYEVGDTVKVDFWRGSDEREAWIALGERPQ